MHKMAPQGDSTQMLSHLSCMTVACELKAETAVQLCVPCCTIVTAHLS